MRSFLCIAAVLFAGGVVSAQSENYGPPMPIVPNGGSITHNGWTLSSSQNFDHTNATTNNYYDCLHNGQIVLQFRVTTSYGGPSATTLWAAPGWSLSNSGTFLQAYGRGISNSEPNWQVGDYVRIWEERYWGIGLAAKHEEYIPGHGTQTNYYGLSGFDWLWSRGKEVKFYISDGPEYE